MAVEELVRVVSCVLNKAPVCSSCGCTGVTLCVGRRRASHPPIDPPACDVGYTEQTAQPLVVVTFGLNSLQEAAYKLPKPGLKHLSAEFEQDLVGV